MVFSSLVFLCAFFPVVVGIYAICPLKYKNFWLMLSSFFFYAWGEPVYVFIMIFSTVFDYINGRLLEYFDLKEMEAVSKENCRKAVLFISVFGNLAILFVFKYFDFLITSWNQATSSELGLLHLALPIGISFYTFQTMSYTIDVYKKEVKAQHNLIAFGMYVSMFPQLIAGPIVRYRLVESEMRNRTVTVEQWVHGMRRFLIGLGKKVLFANQIGALWDDISGTAGSGLSMAGAWIGAIAFTFQIYFDFSGYSDMAIGLGEMFGFHFPENFLHPYEAESITEFWRKWHITLSGWFRDYVYIPLGGNRSGIIRQIFNLFIVWFLTGFWHGASWNFVLWGLYYFVLLVLEKLFLLKETERWRRLFRHLYAKFFIIVGWTIFANEDFSQLESYLKTMFGVNGELFNSEAVYQFRTYLPLMVILALASTRIPGFLYNKGKDLLKKSGWKFILEHGEKLENGVCGAATVVILVLSLGMLISGSYNPFLYFRF